MKPKDMRERTADDLGVVAVLEAGHEMGQITQGDRAAGSRLEVESGGNLSELAARANPLRGAVKPGTEPGLEATAYFGPPMGATAAGAHAMVLEVDPESHQVLAEFDYGDVEAELGYETRYPVGIMEGLAVTRDTFWLATDNNGLPRLKEPKDIRPSLLKLQRPDAPHNAVPTASR